MSQAINALESNYFHSYTMKTKFFFNLSNTSIILNETAY